MSSMLFGVSQDIFRLYYYALNVFILNVMSLKFIFDSHISYSVFGLVLQDVVFPVIIFGTYC